MECTVRSVCSLLPLKVEAKDFLVTLFGERDPSSLGHAGAGKMLKDVWMFEIENSKWTRSNIAGDALPPSGWFGADVMVDGKGKP